MSERPSLEVVGDWVFTTCILFGTSRSTAYLVAGEFIRGLERGDPPPVQPERISRTRRRVTRSQVSQSPNVEPGES